ncbi:MAG TPA: diacylglycerol kinase family protein [Allosphingosinicella sp.]|jgi:diacylglycerol kinase family enzyme
MRSPTVQLFYNRTAGGHCARRLDALRSGFEARGARVLLSECGPGAPVAVADDASHVCAIGGDGTVRHVALALARCGRPLPLSVYPAGTVNLLHRESGFPLDPDQHAGRLLGAEGGERFHPVEINDTLFLACASVGPDSRAVAALSVPLKRRIGKLAYAVAFLGVLVRWQRQPIRLLCEGRTIPCEAFYVAKGRFFAGPWSFAPEARVADPRLHVVALTRARRRDFLRFALALWRGRPVEALPGIVAFTCTGFTAEATEPLPVQADGDLVAALPLQVRLHADPLPLC